MVNIIIQNYFALPNNSKRFANRCWGIFQMILGQKSNDIVSWNHYLLSFYDEYLIIYIDLIVNWELILCFHSFKLIHIMNNSKQTKKPFSLASVLFVLVTSCCYMRRQKNKCLSAFTFLSCAAFDFRFIHSFQNSNYKVKLLYL